MSEEMVPADSYAEALEFYEETRTAAAAMFKVVQPLITYRGALPDSVRHAVDSYVEEFGEEFPVSSYYQP